MVWIVECKNVLKSVVEVWAPRGAQLGRLRQHGDSLRSTAEMVGAHAWAPSAGFQPQKSLFAKKVIPVSELAFFRRKRCEKFIESLRFTVQAD